MQQIDLTSRQQTISAPVTIGAADGAEKVIGNILSLGGGEILARVIAFAGTAYLARKLEPAGFGIVGFATALFSYFQFAVAAGFQDIGAREVARRPQEAPDLAAAAIVVRMVLAVAALAALSVIAWCLDKPQTVKLVVILTGLSLFSLALDTSWVYKGLERNRPVGWALILGQALYAGIILLFIHSPADVARVPLAQFCGELGAAAGLTIPLLRRRKIKPDWRAGWAIFRASWLPALTRLLRTLLFTFAVLVLGFMLDEKAVGLYTAPYRICFLLLSLAAAIQVSYLPAITRAAAQGKAQAAAMTGRAIHLAVTVAMPLVGGGMVLAAPLLKVTFGAGYPDGAPAFRFLLASVGCIFIFGAIHNLLLAYDRLRVELLIMAIVAGLNVALNLVLIPRYGLAGAGAVAALGEVIALGLGLAAVWRLGVKPDLRMLWRPLTAAALMGAGLALLGPHRGLTARLIAGAAIYLLALAALRGIPHEVQAPLRQMASNLKAAAVRAARKRSGRLIR